MSFNSRIITFSLADISIVKIKIDGGTWNTCKHVSGPLFVSQWDPLKYGNGMHHIEVKLGSLKLNISQFHRYFAVRCMLKILMEEKRLSLSLFP